MIGIEMSAHAGQEGIVTGEYNVGVVYYSLTNPVSTSGMLMSVAGVAENVITTTSLGWREWQSVGRLPWARGSGRVWDDCLGLEGVAECGTAALG